VSGGVVRTTLEKSKAAKWLHCGILLALILFVTFGSSSAWSSHPLGIVRFAEFQMLPTQYKRYDQVSTRSEDFVCYAGNKEDNRALNCTFTYEVLGLKEPTDTIDNNGGHSHHEDTRPLTYPMGYQLIYGGTDYDDNPLRVQSNTEGRLEADAIPVTYILPDIAGKVVTQSDLILPPGWYCLSNCYTENSWRWLRVIDIGSEEQFIKLPENTEYYIRCPFTSGCKTDTANDSHTHPEMFYGDSKLISAITYIAAFYRLTYTDPSGRKLRVTDMQLPRGGLFDVKNNWASPHVTHRRGKNADISRHSIVDSGIFGKANSVQFQDLADDIPFIDVYWETSTAECPAYKPGETPCIHLIVH
jgi:hypothetical protein